MIFIALQCCQCSTMQVKQQKKISNKWTCVVCNQKQSVRKVFAQGSMARDVRSFVQSFNMARKVADERSHLEQTVEEEEEEEAIVDDRIQTKKRRDWTEYLDFEDDVKEEGEDDKEIVTELPREMFKKPKLRGGFGRGEGSGLFKPIFSKRSFNKQVMCKGLERTSTIASNDVSPVKRVSKWNQYTTQDDDLTCAAAAGQWGSDDVLETVATNDQMVEHIHPDFL